MQRALPFSPSEGCENDEGLRNDRGRENAGEHWDGICSQKKEQK